MSQYMQESSYINPYYGAGASQNACGASSGSDSPTATAAALAAYYGTSAAGFGASTGSAASGYASYYNYMSAAAGFYPSHQSSYSYGAAGTGASGVTGTSGAHADDYTRKHAPEPVYHLNTLPPPPSIVEPGTNSLDDVLKSPSKKILKFFLNFFSQNSI